MDPSSCVAFSYFPIAAACQVWAVHPPDSWSRRPVAPSPRCCSLLFTFLGDFSPRVLAGYPGPSVNRGRGGYFSTQWSPFMLATWYCRRYCSPSALSLDSNCHRVAPHKMDLGPWPRPCWNVYTILPWPAGAFTAF